MTGLLQQPVPACHDDPVWGYIAQWPQDACRYDFQPILEREVPKPCASARQELDNGFPLGRDILHTIKVHNLVQNSDAHRRAPLAAQRRLGLYEVVQLWRSRIGHAAYLTRSLQPCGLREFPASRHGDGLTVAGVTNQRAAS